MERKMEIPETVILEMHKAAHRLKKDLVCELGEVSISQEALVKAQHSAECVEHQLREVLAFLAEHNSECCDWWAEFDMTPNAEWSGGPPDATNKQGAGGPSARTPG